MITKDITSLVWFIGALSFSSAYYFRFCRNDLVSNVKVTNITHHYLTYVSNKSSGTTVQLKLNVSWTLFVPEGLSLDGILVQLKDTFNDESTEIPTNQCNAGFDHLWITTSNEDICSNQTTACGSMSGSNSTTLNCLCSVKNCSLLYDGNKPGCHGVDSFMAGKQGGEFISVQPEVRNLIYDVEFHKTYDLKIIPYHREFTAGWKNYPEIIAANSDCPKSVSTSSAHNLPQATEICCQMGIPHALARNISFKNFVPDYNRNLVNMTATWLPPINQLNLTGFLCYPIVNRVDNSVFERQVHPFSTKPKKIGYSPQSPVASCDNLTFAYESILYNLIPGQTYVLQITPRYEEEQELDHRCWEGRCSSSVVFTVPELNSCEWGFCHNDAHCQPIDKTGTTTLKANCTCNPGYVGDGMNNSWSVYSRGCVDENLCNLLGNKSLCAKGAICEDKPAPEVGVLCRCPDDFYGNAYVGSNGGCLSKALLGAKVGIPATLVITLLLVFIAWKLKMHNVQKMKFKFKQFQSSKSKPISSLESA